MIDLNRGVTKRIHPDGFAVCMYKDDPGVYYDSTGTPLSMEVAKEARFPVEQYARARERLAKAKAALEAIAMEYGEIPVGHVIETSGDYAVVHAGEGQFHVCDKDTNRLTKAMDREAAVRLVRRMAASEAAAPQKPNPSKEK